MLIILRGPAASGKSTYTSELIKNDPSLVVVNRDSLRFSFFGKYAGVDEEFISQVEKRSIRDALIAGKTVVSDNTNLTPRFVNALVDIAYQLGRNVELVDHFKEVPLEECLARNAARDRHVPEKVLIDQWMRSQKQYTLPTRPEDIKLYADRPTLPPAILVDLDGTAAIMGERSPYDDMQAGIDSRNDAVHATVCAMSKAGIEIVYLSGRQDRARKVTADWLNANDYPWGKLLMRTSGDQRKDWVIKNEIFENYIAGKYRILFALDDRQQVVDMYRRKGLSVFQVNEGDF